MRIRMGLKDPKVPFAAERINEYIVDKGCATRVELRRELQLGEDCIGVAIRKMEHLGMLQRCPEKRLEGGKKPSLLYKLGPNPFNPNEWARRGGHNGGNQWHKPRDAFKDSIGALTDLEQTMKGMVVSDVDAQCEEDVRAGRRHDDGGSGSGLGGPEDSCPGIELPRDEGPFSRRFEALSRYRKGVLS